MWPNSQFAAHLITFIEEILYVFASSCLFRTQSSFQRLIIFTKKVHRRCSMDLNSLWWSYFPILLKVSDFLINTYTGTLKPHQNFYNVSKVFFVLKVNLLKGVILGSITTPKYFQNKFKDPRAKNENHAVY